MRWSAKKRMEFIESRLFWEGKISRKDITDFFDISIPQATKDIKAYSELALENIRYDPRAKQYVTGPDFKSKISQPSSDSYLSRLRILKESKDRNYFFNGPIPPFSEMPQFRRFVDTDVLRTLVRAIHNKDAIKINYQSMSSSKPKTRWITPHSLGHDGSRWHVRSLCHNEKIYKDFNLGRIIEISNSSLHDIDHSIDYEWHNEISVVIAPNPVLEGGKKACIERDYCMKNGKTSLKIKAAFFYYFKLRFLFNGEQEDKQGNKQQIQLLNLDEINANIDLLKSMSKNKVNELIAAGNFAAFIARNHELHLAP